MGAAARIAVDVVGDASSAVRALNAADRAAAGLGTTTGGKLSAGLKIAGVAALGLAGVVGAGLVGALKVGFSELKEMESALATTETVLGNLGNKTKITADNITEWADAMQGMTGIPDDVIVSAENTLLRFDALSGDSGTFQRTLDVAADMSVALGKELPAAAQILGRALADPETAAGKLARMGVVLNAEQQKTIDKFIETGNQAGALEYLLGLLETKFGGIAEAAGDTTAGKIEILKRKFEDIAEALAGKLLPYADRFIDWLGRILDSGSVSGALDEIASGFGNLAREILDAITGKIAEINWVDVGKTVFTGIVGAIKTAFTAGGGLAEQMGIGPALQTALGTVAAGLTGLLIAGKVAGAIGSLAGAVGRLFGALGSLAGVLTKIPLPILGAVIAVGAVAAAIIWVDKLTDANKELKDAVDDAKAALEGQATAADGLTDASRGLEDAHARVEQAALTLNVAEKEVARIADAGGKKTDAYAQAQLNLEAAKTESKRAAEDLATAEKDLAGATDTLKKSTDDVNTSLVDVYKNMDVTKSSADSLGGRVDYVKGQFDSFGGMLGSVQTGLQGVGSAASGARPGLDMAAGGADTFKGAADHASDSAGELASKIKDIPDNSTTTVDMPGFPAAKDAADRVAGAVRGVPDSIKVTASAHNIGPTIAQLNAVRAAAQDVVMSVTTVVNEVVGTVVNQNPAANFAGGTRDFRGGWALVGESGPELVNLPRGSDVYTATDSRAMTNGAGLEPWAGGGGSGDSPTIIVNVHVAGSVVTKHDLARDIRDALLQGVGQANPKIFGR